MAVGDTVKADDGTVNEFLHDILHLRQILIKRRQFIMVFQLVGGFGAAAVVRFDDDGVSHFLDESLGGLQRGDHMVPCHRDTRRAVAFLHLALEFDEGNKIILGTGGDIEIGPQLGVHLQPVLIVAFQPVDLAVTEGKVSYGTHHGIVIGQAVHAVILGQAGLELFRNLVVRGVSDAQDVHAVAAQAVTEIPVTFGKMRRYKNKIHDPFPHFIFLRPLYRNEAGGRVDYTNWARLVS